MSVKKTKALLSAGGIALAVLLSTAPVHAQPTNAALAPTAQQVTEDQFKRYYELFNVYDPQYGEFLADDVIYTHPSGRVFRGRKEIMDQYQNQATRVHDKRIPTFIAVDNERGRAAVEMRNQFSTDEGKTYTFSNGIVIQPGEVWEGSAVLIYELKDGKISSIRGSLTGPGRLKKITPAQ